VFTFIHTADLHLDSPFKEITAKDGKIGEILRNATFKAFDDLVKLCIDENVDFLLIAGDIFDSSNKILRTQLKFREGLAKLDEKNIKIFIVCGNHDPLNEWKLKFDFAKSVHFFPIDNVEKITLTTKSGDKVIIHGISYGVKDEHRNLASMFKRVGKGSAYEIGMLHCNVGSDTGHEPYAECSKQNLIEANMDYWALGHIHKRNILSKDPYIVYPGNIQGRHINEAGEKGCYLVRVENNRTQVPEFKILNSVIWKYLEVDMGKVGSFDKIYAKIEDECKNKMIDYPKSSILFRLMLKGRNNIGSELDFEKLQELCETINENNLNDFPFYWITDVISKIKPLHDIQNLMESDGFIGDLLKAGNELRKNESLKDAFRKIFDEFSSKKELLKAIEGMDENELEVILKDAEYLCVDKLLD